MWSFYHLPSCHWSQDRAEMMKARVVGANMVHVVVDEGGYHSSQPKRVISTSNGTQ